MLVLLLLLLDVPLIPTLWLGWFLPFLILNQMRIWFAKLAIGVSGKQYWHTVFTPLLFIGTGSFAFSFGFKALAGDAVWLILAGAAANAVVVGTLFWLLIGSAERRFLGGKFLAAWSQITRAGHSR